MRRVTSVYVWLTVVVKDNTIIATAIPRITDQFKALEDVGWYGSSYLLVTCMFQLIFGKLYGYFPIKWVFLAAIIIFEIGSAVCGAAPTSDAFIVGRSIAGLGASGIFQGAMVIVAYSVEPRKRPLCAFSRIPLLSSYSDHSRRQWNIWLDIRYLVHRRTVTWRRIHIPC